jgi:hypothetical protein
LRERVVAAVLFQECRKVKLLARRSTKPFNKREQTKVAPQELNVYFEKFIDHDFFAKTYQELFSGSDLTNPAEIFDAYIIGNKTGCLDPNPNFNEAAYRAANPDVVRALKNGIFVSGYHHWLLHGQKEARGEWGRGAAVAVQEDLGPRQEGVKCEAMHIAARQQNNDFNTAFVKQAVILNQVVETIGEADLPTANADRTQAQDKRYAYPQPTEAAIIAKSGLFDAVWYLASYPQLGLSSDAEALADFVSDGWRSLRNPNEDFSTRHYLTQYPDVASTGINPLVHYILAGDKEGRQPSILLDVNWYRTAYSIDVSSQTCLAHYRAHKNDLTSSPTPYFDPAYYVRSYPDIAEAGVHPFTHYMYNGHQEGRDPSPLFKTEYYRATWLFSDRSVNPLLHFLQSASSTRFRRTTNGGGLASPNGRTSPRRHPGSSVTTSPVFRVTSASTT